MLVALVATSSGSVKRGLLGQLGALKMQYIPVLCAVI